MAKRHHVVVGALVLAAFGCSSPPAESPPAPPEPFRAGDCFAADSGDPVDCSEKHAAQAVYVGDEPPGSNAEALAPCRRAQAKFLGQDFNTRLDIKLWVAHDESSFRCDVVLRKSTQGGSGYQVLTGSLDGVLRNGTGVDLRACLGVPYDPASDQIYVPCREPHATQALIVAPAIGTLEEDFPDDIDERATNACNATADAAGELEAGRTVSAFYPDSASAWATGERTTECWIAAKRGSLPAVTSNAR